MTQNPFRDLLLSRRFWLLMLDTVITLVIYFIAKYSPAAEADVRTVIFALQPVFLLLIGALTYDDSQAAKLAAGKEKQLGQGTNAG
jgi:hypothetical protein